MPCTFCTSLLLSIVYLCLPPSTTAAAIEKMTTYGTIPTAAPPSSNLQLISQAKHRIQAGLGTRRPWMDMVQLHYLALPSSFGQVVERIKVNGAFFRMNYAIITLFILFVSLLWQPMSLIVFILVLIAWLFLYFLRDEPLIVFGRLIDDRMVLVALLLLTIIALFFTHARDNLIVALSVSLVVIVLHGAVRETDDIFFDDELGLDSAAADGDIARVLPLRSAASSSFSSS